MEVIKEQKAQEDQSETSMATEKESMCNVIIVNHYILNTASLLNQVTVYFEISD